MGLLKLQQQQSSVSTSTFTTGSPQTSGLSTSQVSGSSTVSASQQVSAAEEQAIVLRIIEVLTPSITSSVRRALASRVHLQLSGLLWFIFLLCQLQQACCSDHCCPPALHFLVGPGSP